MVRPPLPKVVERPLRRLPNNKNEHESHSFPKMRYHRQPNAWKAKTSRNKHRRNHERNSHRLQPKNLLQIEKLSKFDFKTIVKQATKFTKSVIASLTKNEIKTIDQFFQFKMFKPNLIDRKELLNEKIKEHPAILLALANLV